MSQLYFAYGSNLSTKQITERCPSSKAFKKATLSEHALVFHMHYEPISGGAAGIEPRSGHEVEGMVYEMSDDDLLVMDGFEGVPDGWYTRREITVKADDGSDVTCWTYFSNGEEGAHFPPGSAYLGRILTGAKEHGLSDVYVQRLEGLSVAEDLSAIRS